MTWIFWLSLSFLAYTFLGYPALLCVLALGRNGRHKRAAIWPTVSMIISAHNEATVIRHKIENVLELDYPRDKIEIIVASDGSVDGTNEIVSSFKPQGVKLINIPQRQGKHYAQMIARDAARGEVIVFSDASVIMEPHGLRKLVENFADSSVGCVSSEDEIETNEGHGIGECLYVQGEMGLRRLESRVDSVISVSGSLFAARRDVCTVWHSNHSSDFFVPLHTVAQGLRAVVDTRCRARLGALPSGRAEFRRKVRTIVHGLDGLFLHLKLLNFFRYGWFSWQLISHKLFRWLVPYALAVLLISSIFLWKANAFYRFLLAMQLAGYAVGLLALALGQRVDSKPLKLTGYFVLGNAATIFAWLNFFLGEKHVTWQPSQRV